MKLSQEKTDNFETQIKFQKVEIKLEEVDVNILEFWQQPLLPNEGDNYTWDLDIGMSTDVEEDEPHDSFTCYINAELHMKGQQYFIIKLNTLHSYQVTKLSYKKNNEELFKSIARESVLHANDLLSKEAKGTAYEGFLLPDEEEDELNELAEFWNKRGYIPQAAVPDENAVGRKLSTNEMDALSKKAGELVAWIDAYDEKEQSQVTEEETMEYYQKYAEWAKLNKQLWHFKMIARNQLAYTLTKIMVKLEKGLERFPDDYDLCQSYEGMKEDYESFMSELKEEFAKN